MAGLFGKYQVLLAPMAGVSDIALRILCREQGADLTYTEMVSAKGLSYANDKTRGLLDVAAAEEEVAVQLFGHEPETMAAQAAWVEEILADKLAYLDVNMGCPARKIVTKGDGSALMNEPELAEAIVRAMTGVVSHPVTVKFRRGWSLGDETAVEFAKRMEQAGAAAVAIHGRYAQQMYQGAADWGVIGRVKDAVGVFVVGNGDVTSGERATSMFEQTGCDAVMIARGAQGNPWVFADVKASLSGATFKPPTVLERIAMARRHATLLNQRDARNIVRMRKHACWYMHGLPGASKARLLFNQCSTLDDFNEVFDMMELHYAS